MEKKCDVLVVGAGPAGLATAIITSKAGLKTIIVEKSSEIGYPVKTSAFTWKETWEEWGLSPNVVHQEQDSFYIKSANSSREVEINFGRVVGGVLNYHVFLRELAFQAISNRVKFCLCEKVVNPLIDGDYVNGVLTSTKKSISAKVVVDCSGPSAVIARKAGLLKNAKEKELGMGMEYEMKGVKIRNPRAIDFYVGKKSVVPVGYGWIFPLSVDSARVGVSMVYNTPDSIEEKNIKVWLDNFVGSKSIIHERLKLAQPYEMHVGGYALSGMIDKPYANGLLVAGDAAAHASMLLGEGIRYAMNFGRLAGKVIIKANRKNDFSEDFLASYQSDCLNYLGETYDVAQDILQVPTDEYWENVINAMIILKKERNTELILKYLKTAMNYENARRMFPNFAKKYLRG